jgi:hypothetical protein
MTKPESMIVKVDKAEKTKAKTRLLTCPSAQREVSTLFTIG